MKALQLIAVGLALVVACGGGSDDAVPSGQWQGRLGGFEVTAAISGDTTFSGTFVLPALNETIETPVMVRGDSVLISLATDGMGSIVLAGLYEDTLIGGTFILEGAEREFFLKRVE